MSAHDEVREWTLSDGSHFTGTYHEAVMAGMSDGQLLAWMGTDSGRWAREFLRTRTEIVSANDGRDPNDEGWLRSWFANAIEAGRDAGRRGR